MYYPWYRNDRSGIAWFELSFDFSLDICQSRKSKNNFSAMARIHQGYAVLKKYIVKIPQQISKRLQRE